MCDFCDNIKNIEEHCEMSSWDRHDAIVKKSNGIYSLWIECDDYYYSGTVMDIAFCPICGRKLNAE